MEERKGRAETLEKGPFRACKCLSKMVSTNSHIQCHSELLTWRPIAVKLRTLLAKCRDTGVRSPLGLRWHMIKYCVAINIDHVEYRDLRLREVTARCVHFTGAQG